MFMQISVGVNQVLSTQVHIALISYVNYLPKFYFDLNQINNVGDLFY